MADLWGEEEDNAPYTFTHRDSASSADEQPDSPNARFKQPATPPSHSYPSRTTPIPHQTPNDSDSEEGAQRPPVERKQGGYDSRVEQILYEHPEAQITITHAGKNVEGGGSYIAYTIRTGDLEVRRRYRDFASLRDTLVNLHPTLIIPPIPEKHTIAEYAAKPTKAKEDEGVIEHRKRMLTSFLNRCKRMREVREDGVYWKFLDPNASWSEVLHSHPVSSLPKNNLKAPPLDPANPTPGHNYLPVPSQNAKLKSQKDSKSELSGTPASPPASSYMPSAAAHTTSGPQIFGRFPPPSHQLGEAELDPYFVNFESSSRELEALLQGSMEKVNRRTLSHLSSLAEDMSELGARLNGFSLSEQSQTLAAAIEKLGQAVDSTYIATGDMSASLAANFSDPMRESAQFAGIVRNVLRYRIMKRIQGEMTQDELERKRTLLNQLERSELEAQRIEEHLTRSGFVQPGTPQRSNSARSSSERPRPEDDTASVDSDFPQSESQATPSASQGLPPKSEPSSPTHKKTGSGNFVTNKIFGRINHAIHGIVDVDPERTRRDQIGKTRESLAQLEQALDVSDKDVKEASSGVLKSLQQFQSEKEDDLRRYMMAYARVHIDWSKRNLASWEEAKAEVDKIDTAINPLQRYIALPPDLFWTHRYPQPLPFELPSWAAQTRTSLTTSSQNPYKKQKHTYSNKHSASNTHADIFAPEEQSSSVASPGSSPTPTVSGAPSTPRYIPPHLQDEVKGAAAVSRGVAAAGRAVVDEAGMPRSTSSASDESTQNGFAQSDRGSSPTVSFAETGAEQSMRQLGVGARAASPAKRSAAEYEEDVDGRQQQANPSSSRRDSAGSARKKSTSQQYVSPMPARFKAINGAVQDHEPMLLDHDNGTSTVRSNAGSDTAGSLGHDMNGMHTPSTSGSAPTVEVEIGNSAEHSSEKRLPSYDEQVEKITEIAQSVPDSEGLKGYLVSNRWINRVRSRTTAGLRESFDKDAREGEVGPVDNSDIVNNGHFYGDLRDAHGEPFVPLREGIDGTSIDVDFSTIPQAAWELIINWYGIAEPSHVVARYMHSTAASDSFLENFQYELNPPICTVQRLQNDSNGISMDDVRNKDASARSIVVSRSDKVQVFLKRLKSVAEIDLKTKVRMWRLLETGSTTVESSKMPTPASSRAGSPAKQDSLPRTRPKLVVDMNAFIALEEGITCERLEIDDRTASEVYGGDDTLAAIGLPSHSTLILDEKVQGKEEFVSDAVRRRARELGIELKSSKPDKGGGNSSLKPKDTTGSGRRSPTPSGMMTRGRSTRKGRTRGCTGLQNLGNTCYMNSALQCIRSVEELTLYFLSRRHLEELNPDNPLGHKAAIAKAYDGFVNTIYSPDSSGSFAPRNFKATLGRCQPLFSGYGQQDSQEFLSFLVDGLHEDLNRVHKKPYVENPESDDNTVHDPEAVRQLGEKFREGHKRRNDSVAMDLFNGFYKNTMVCPVCDKVSITFDPYSLLTLQLPFENTFQHRCVFFPLNDRPLWINVDVDKNSSIRVLKDWVGKRVGVPGDRLIMVEEYNNKLFQVLDDSQTISEANLNTNDNLYFCELDDVPTNWPTLGGKRSTGYSVLNNNDPIPSMDSEMAERMAVPLLHRVHSGRHSFKTDYVPTMILLTRNEAKDPDLVLRKILQKVQTLTSRDLTIEPDVSKNVGSTGNSSTPNFSDDGSSNEEGQPKTRSVDSEEGFVDISMDGNSQAALTNGLAEASPRQSNFLDPSYFIIPELRQMFEIKLYSGQGVIPQGLNAGPDSQNLVTLEERYEAQQRAVRARRRSSTSSRRSRRSSASDEDELSREHDPKSQNTATVEDSEEDERPLPPHRPGQLRPISKTGRRRPMSDPNEDYLVRLGEGLVLEWSGQGWDQLFAADGERGHQTFAQNMEEVSDPELEEKKARRATRKKHGVSLDECFEETAKSEVLSEDNAWYCGRCKERRRAQKTLEIWTAPDILVIHLKRFSSQSRMRDKIDVLVDFPIEGLDLSGKVGLPEDKSMLYDLFAVDCHYGGLGGGHYTAYAKNFFDGKWYDYNDQMVSSANPEAAVSKSAYLLFYRRRSDKPLGGQLLENVVNEAYSNPDPTLLSGEESRPDDSSYNGSSNGLQGAGAAARTGAVAYRPEEDARDPGSLNGYQQSLGDTARRGLEADGEDGLPPPYQTSFEDEGIGMDSSNDFAMPSHEDENGGRGFIGPLDQGSPHWGFGNIPRGEPSAPAVSEAGDSTTAHNDDDDAGFGRSRLDEDFPDYGQILEFQDEPTYADDPGSDHVEHVSIHEPSYEEDPPVAEIHTSTSDEEEAGKS